MSFVIANNYRISFAPDAVKGAKYSLSRLQTVGAKTHFSLTALYDSKVLLVRDIISDSLFRQVLNRDIDSIAQICEVTESLVNECVNAFSLLENSNVPVGDEEDDQESLSSCMSHDSYREKYRLKSR